MLYMLLYRSPGGHNPPPLPPQRWVIATKCVLPPATQQLRAVTTTTPLQKCARFVSLERSRWLKINEREKNEV